eukprot:GILK01006719.1.p1 GENE.GILK01006719.1~~GILK01006719.1.p1  ORF type:complete len:652 (-),score=85.85 GILK01006719.1:95-2050(-)
MEDAGGADFARALVREYLYRLGLRETLALMDNEMKLMPEHADKHHVKLSRSEIVKGLKLERIMKKYKDKGQTPTILEGLVSYLRLRAVGTSGTEDTDDSKKSLTDSAAQEQTVLHHTPKYVGAERPASKASSASALRSNAEPIRKVLSVTSVVSKQEDTVQYSSTKFEGSFSKRSYASDVSTAVIMERPRTQGSTNALSDSFSTQDGALTNTTRNSRPFSAAPVSVSKPKVANWGTTDAHAPAPSPYTSASASTPASAPVYPSTSASPSPSSSTSVIRVAATSSSVSSVSTTYEAPFRIQRPIDGSSSSLAGQRMTLQQGKELRTLLFGAASGVFNENWLQGFYFVQEDFLYYGLMQKEGGPCGVIATVQAFLLRHLFFGSDSSHGSESRQLSLWQAMTDILWQAGQKAQAMVVLPTSSIPSASSAMSMDKYVVHSLSSRDSLLRLLQTRGQEYINPTGAGVIMFIYSLLLSRGVENIRGDMDDSNTTFIGRHGYCTQEMVNLMLTGKATSNVFDGEQQLQGEKGSPAMVLRGIPARGTVGFLTLLERYGYLQVGDHFKCPQYPIWVICSESHYTVLFSMQMLSAQARQFDLFYFDGLGRQDEEIRLSVSLGTKPHTALRKVEDMVPPIDECIISKWPTASVDWNGVDPLL